MQFLSLVVAGLSSVFQFAGGTEIALAAEIAKEVRAPVAILRSDVQAHPKRTLRVESHADLRAQVGNLFGVRGPTGGPWGLATRSWPTPVVRPERRDTFWRVKSVVASAASRSLIEAGSRSDRVTIRQGADDWFDLARLREFDWGKPIRSHWLYEQMLFAVVAEDVPRSEVLQTLAHALGSRLVTTPNSFSFEFNPEAMRSRLVAWLRQEAGKSRPVGRRTSLMMQADVFNALSASQLRQLFSQPEGQLEVDALRLPGARQAIDRYLAAEYGPNTNVKGPTGESMHVWLRKNLCHRRPWLLHITAQPSVVPSLPLNDGRGIFRG